MLQFVHICVARGRSSVGGGNVTKCLQLVQLLTNKLQIVYGKFINKAKVNKTKQKNLQSVHKSISGARKVIASARAPANVNFL